MKRCAALLAALALCLGLCACNGAPVTVAQEISVMGEWVCVGDESDVVFFDESSYCTEADGSKVKFKCRVDFDELMIFGQKNRVFKVVKENGIYMLYGQNVDQVYVRAEDYAAAYDYLFGGERSPGNG